MFLMEFLKLWIKMHTCIPVISKISVKTHRISYFSKVSENVHDILKNIGSSFFLSIVRTRVIDIKIVPRLSDRAEKAVVESSDGGDGDDGEKL